MCVLLQCKFSSHHDTRESRGYSGLRENGCDVTRRRRRLAERRDLRTVFGRGDGEGDFAHNITNDFVLLDVQRPRWVQIRSPFNLLHGHRNGQYRRPSRLYVPGTSTCPAKMARLIPSPVFMCLCL